jgi:hypothetical protein
LAGAVLVGKLSLMSALAAGYLVKSPMKYNRSFKDILSINPFDGKTVGESLDVRSFPWNMTYKVIIKLKRYFFFKYFEGISLLQITLIFCSIGWFFDSLVMYMLLAKSNYVEAFVFFW